MDLRKWQARDKVVIRTIEDRDALIVSNLMEQLGYPVNDHEIPYQIHLYNRGTSLLSTLDTAINFFVGHTPEYFDCAFVAELDGEVIGCLALNIMRLFHKPGRFGRIVAMIVDEKYRRMGVGKKLLQHAESYAKKIDCRAIELTSGLHRESMGSHTFYERQGFQDQHKRCFWKDLEAPQIK